MNALNIGIFGRRNVGKSSIINTLAGQDVAIVSDSPGTTTDPVVKRMEISGIGPCVLIDTAGIDDSGTLGSKRVVRSLDVVARIDMAVLVFAGNEFGEDEERLLGEFRRYSLPVTLVHNKADQGPVALELAGMLRDRYGLEPVEYSALACTDVFTSMRDRLIQILKEKARTSEYQERPMFDGIVSAGQHVLLVCPIDSGAPTGRLILPQVNAIRNILDIGDVATVVQPSSISGTAGDWSWYDLVVTDSQAFSEVAAAVPESVPLTSFSMLLARSKGCFKEYCEGTPAIDNLKDGDRVLILESCSHHSSCEDIGRVKIPALMRRYTGRDLTFDVVGGLDRIARPVSDYSLVLQCGGCMITRRQLMSRLLPAVEAGVPVTNYGMAISYMKGIYERALRPLLK